MENQMKCPCEGCLKYAMCKQKVSIECNDLKEYYLFTEDIGMLPNLVWIKNHSGRTHIKTILKIKHLKLEMEKLK